MSLRVIGAGLGRTGTASLKAALEQLLGAPCYHMLEVFQNPDHMPVWTAAARGEPVDWDAALGGYVATVDWPAASFWQDLLALNPEAIVLLSTRSSSEAWWRSANDTIFAGMSGTSPNPEDPFTQMWTSICASRFTPDWRDEKASIAAYERHNADVRASAPPERLVEWQPGDGWEPLCTALGLPLPADDFPHHNSTDDFRQMMGLDPPNP